MSDFKCPIIRVSVEPHPNADTLDVVTAFGYKCIAKKGRFQTGDFAVYVPEGALVPEEIMKSEGFWDETKNRGILSGSGYNRVKAISLRGILSQGILFAPPQIHLKEGDDLAEHYGITKYIPEIPSNFAGEVEYEPEFTYPFDVEDIKKYPEYVFDPKDEYIITEKLHGTFCAFSWVKGKGWRAYSKGLGAKGLVFKNNEENAKNNLYVKMLNSLIIEHISTCNPKFSSNIEIKDTVAQRINEYNLSCGYERYIIFGEIYGKGIQDLSYGVSSPKFRIFGFIVEKNDGQLLKYSTNGLFSHIFKDYFAYHIDYVPVLHQGPVTRELIQQYTTGKTTLGEGHIREGVVITSANTTLKLPDEHRKFFFMKSINPEYLLRKNGTEFN